MSDIADMTKMTNDQIIALWYHYEEIAMHFNGLIMQYRLQIMGGLGAVGSIVGYLIGEKVHSRLMQVRLRFFASFMVLILVGAAALLDVFYYERLLQGSVVALKAFEKKHPEINMSTVIAEKVSYGCWAIWVVYGMMIVVLGWFCSVSWISYARFKKLEKKGGGLRAPAHSGKARRHLKEMIEVLIILFLFPVRANSFTDVQGHSSLLVSFL